MWLYDWLPMSPKYQPISLTAGLMLLLFASACTLRPLYVEGRGAGAEAGPDVVAAMSRIKIDPPATSGFGRAGTVLRQRLEFAFTSPSNSHQKKAAIHDPRRKAGEHYRLRIWLDGYRREVGIAQLADIPSAQRIHLTANFILRSEGDEKLLLSGQSFASSTFDFSSQRFANLRAERDAVERTAELMAEDITARIAAYFSQQSHAN